jgi:hypothetical protein
VSVALPVEEFVSGAGEAGAAGGVAPDVADPAALEAVAFDAEAAEGWLLEDGTGGAVGVSGCGSRTSGCWLVLLPLGAI